MRCAAHNSVCVCALWIICILGKCKYSLLLLVHFMYVHSVPWNANCEWSDDDRVEWDTCYILSLKMSCNLGIKNMVSWTEFPFPVLVLYSTAQRGERQRAGLEFQVPMRRKGAEFTNKVFLNLNESIVNPETRNKLKHKTDRDQFCQCHRS